MGVLGQITASFRSHIFSDFSDRLCTLFTSIFLIVAAILVFLMQHVRFLATPVTCLTPAKFPGSWQFYAQDYCYQQTTFYTQFDSRFPIEEQKPDLRVDHYVVLMFLVLALQFYFLRLLWAALSSKCTTDLSSILKVSSHVADISEPRSREVQVSSLSQFIFDSISKCGILLSVLYLMVKFLFIVNVFMQIRALNYFLKVDNYLWGYEMFDRMNKGEEWQGVPVFPRVVTCDFQFRGDPSNVQRYSVQCVMNISYFLTSLYLVIWYLLIFIGILSIFSFIYWLIITVTSFLPPTRNLWLQKFMIVGRTGKRLAPYEMSRLASQLKPDGLMILHFVASHTNEMLAHELATEMSKNCQTGYVSAPPPTVEPTAPHSSTQPLLYASVKM